MRTFKIALVLALVAGLSGLLIASVNNFTKDRIAEAELEAKNELVSEFYDKNLNVEWEDADGGSAVKSKATITNSDDEVVGYVYEATGTNSYGDISAIIAIDKDNKMLGLKYLKLNQTPGFGDKVETNDYLNKYVNKDIDNLDVDIVSGATYSSKLVERLVDETIAFHNGVPVEAKEAADIPVYWILAIVGIVIIAPIVIWKAGGKRG